MSYARKSDGDVYVYSDVHDRKGEIRCCDCSLLFASMPQGGRWEGPLSFIADGPQEMLNHLREHQVVGHRVPQYAFKRLKKEAASFKPPKHPVHVRTNLLHTDKGENVDSFGPFPLCGWIYGTIGNYLKLPSGFAHPRDTLTQDPKQVTCKQCKKRMKAGLTALYEPMPTKSQTKKTSKKTSHAA